MPATSSRPLRRAARVVLLDPQNRVLLMRYDDGPPNGPHWATPGGGLEPGETYPQAALRELAEETGWTDIVLIGEIHRRSHTMEWAGQMVCSVVVSSARLHQRHAAMPSEACMASTPLICRAGSSVLAR